MQQNYKGFSLFNDIDDAALRMRNRAVVLCNMFEDNSKKALLNPKGLSLIIGYFNNIPAAERPELRNAFATKMEERGYAAV